MALAFNFIVEMARLLLEFSPLLIVFGIIISLLSLGIGRYEGWSISDSLYYGFITATTVGYGDMRPTVVHSKFLAVLLALMGIIFTGIIVAIAVEVSRSIHA